MSACLFFKKLFGLAVKVYQMKNSTVNHGYNEFLWTQLIMSLFHVSHNNEIKKKINNVLAVIFSCNYLLVRFE